MTPTIYDIKPGLSLRDPNGERYTLGDPHRKGGFSTTFSATDHHDESHCEIQIFPSNVFKGEEQMEEFRQRILPWEKVESDAVLRVRGILDLEPSALAIVTDYPEGESLRTRLNRDKRLDLEEVIAVGEQLLAGMEAIHAKSLVHGDIKPYTIHLQGKGSDVRAVLVDGGITACLWNARGLGDTTVLLGTPFYAPVEQFGGDAPSVRSDIYNLATVLFECITGVLPWAGHTFVEVFQSKLKDPPGMSERAPDVQVDPRLEQVVVKACSADRNKRYATAQEFHDAFSALA